MEKKWLTHLPFHLLITCRSCWFVDLYNNSIIKLSIDTLNYIMWNHGSGKLRDVDSCVCSTSFSSFSNFQTIAIVSFPPTSPTLKPGVLRLRGHLVVPSRCPWGSSKTCKQDSQRLPTLVVPVMLQMSRGTMATYPQVARLLSTSYFNIWKMDIYIFF